MLNPDFNYEAFYNALDSYLMNLINEHQKFSDIVKSKRETIKKYSDNIEKTIEDNIDINELNKECSDIEREMNIIFMETTRLQDFTNSFPDKVLVEKSLNLLGNIKKHFVYLEEYERCAILQEVIDSIKD